MFFLQRKKLFNSKIDWKQVLITFKLRSYPNTAYTNHIYINSDYMSFISTDNRLNNTQQSHTDTDGKVLPWEKQPLQWQLDLCNIITTINYFPNKYNFITPSEMPIYFKLSDATKAYRIKFTEKLYGYISELDIDNDWSSEDSNYIKIYLSTSPDGLSNNGVAISSADYSYSWYSVDGLNIKTQSMYIPTQNQTYYYVLLRIDKELYISLDTYHNNKIAKKYSNYWYDYYISDEDPNVLRINLWCSATK